MCWFEYFRWNKTIFFLDKKCKLAHKITNKCQKVDKKLGFLSIWHR